MSKKLSILLSILCGFACALFGGCTFPGFGGGAGSGGDSVGGGGLIITTGTYPKEQQKPGRPDYTVDPVGLDETAFYEKTLDGLKISYDSSAHILQTLSNVRFNQTIDRLQTALPSAYVDFNIKAFVDANPDLGVNATYVSRVLLINNIVEQYKALSQNMLIASLGEWGYGYPLDMESYNPYYRNFNFGDAVYPSATLENPFATNYDAINKSTYGQASIFAVPNPNYNTTKQAEFYDGMTTVDVNALVNLEFNLGAIALPTAMSPWLLNLLGAEHGIYKNGVVVAHEWANPYYDPTNEIFSATILDGGGMPIANPNYQPNHLFGHENIALIGYLLPDGMVEYELVFDYNNNAGNAYFEYPSMADYISKYLNSYTNILALRLMETHVGVYGTSAAYSGSILELTNSAFYAMIPRFVANIGKLGFDEQLLDPFYDEGSGFAQQTVDLADLFTTCILETVVGATALGVDATLDPATNMDPVTSTWFKNYEERVGELVSKYLHMSVEYEDVLGTIVAKEYDELAHALEPIETKTPKYDYYTSIHFIEWADYRISDIVGVKDDFVLPTEKFYSVVFMPKENLEETKQFMDATFLFVANHNELHVDMYFRYVVAGQEVIFEKVDMTVPDEPAPKPDVPYDENGHTNYIINNEFNGTVQLFTGVLDMEYFSKNAISIQPAFIADAVALDAPLSVDGFINNQKSNFVQSLTTMKADNKYKMLNSGLMSYGEKSINCDYVEIIFDIKPVGTGLSTLQMAILSSYFDVI